MYARSHDELATLAALAAGFDDLATIDPHLEHEQVAACVASIRRRFPELVTPGLFDATVRWALAALREPPLDVSPSCAPGARELTARRCRDILACAFLGNVTDPMREHKGNRGGLSFRRRSMAGSATLSVQGCNPVCI